MSHLLNTKHSPAFRMICEFWIRPKPIWPTREKDSHGRDTSMAELVGELQYLVMHRLMKLTGCCEKICVYAMWSDCNVIVHGL